LGRKRGRNNLEDLDVDGRIIVKQILNKWDERSGVDRPGLG
jgi:hypothetical protein